MSKGQSPFQNQLLARLPKDEFERLARKVQAVSFPFKQILYEAHQPIEYAYFPVRGVLSAVTVMEDGSAIEVATIGNEGMTGLLALFGDGTSPNEVMVQVEGDGLRLDVELLRLVAGREGPLRRVLRRYETAFHAQVSQGLACNGLHPVQQRCCRWLLMTQDRVDAESLPLTHEFLAVMLGVRRASVTEVLGPLQDQGLIENHRGVITIVDRNGLEAACCECYRKILEEFHRALD
jgi:CRP-like cAMP-binding protein